MQRQGTRALRVIVHNLASSFSEKTGTRVFEQGLPCCLFVKIRLGTLHQGFLSL
jgi:hypothetical protein